MLVCLFTPSEVEGLLRLQEVDMRYKTGYYVAAAVAAADAAAALAASAAAASADVQDRHSRRRPHVVTTSKHSQITRHASTRKEAPIQYTQTRKHCTMCALPARF